MKGQSVVVTHSLLILFATLLLIIVVTTLNSIKEDYRDFVLNLTAKDICNLVKTSIEELRTSIPTELEVKTEQNMGSIILDLPSKIGNTKYRIRLENETILIKTESGFSYTCYTSVNSTLSGRSTGDRTKIYWVYGSGTNKISITNP
jgi:hypothetical protein